MTCRIERQVVGEGRVILYVSGRITEEATDTLLASLEREGSEVAVDLKDVFIADRKAIELLARCESRGIELRNCPAYIREWVTREAEDRNRSDKRTK